MRSVSHRRILHVRRTMQFHPRQGALRLRRDQKRRLFSGDQGRRQTSVSTPQPASGEMKAPLIIFLAFIIFIMEMNHSQQENVGYVQEDHELDYIEIIFVNQSRYCHCVALRFIMDQGPRFKWHHTNTNTPKQPQAFHSHSKTTQPAIDPNSRKVHLSHQTKTHSPSHLKQKRFNSGKRANPERSNEGSTTCDRKITAIIHCNKKLFTESNPPPSPNFNLKIKQDKQASPITPIMRVIIIDWLMELSQELVLSKQTLHIAVYYLDRVLNKNMITKDELQVYGLCCLMIAQKLQSQKALTPELASSLLQNYKTSSEFINLEQVIVKVLQFKLHPFTLWIEMNILLSACQCYFKLSADEDWLFYKRRCLWVTEGVIILNRYYENVIQQKSICISLLYSIISQYNSAMLPQYPHFLLSLTGLSSQPIPTQLSILPQWLKCKCQCQSPYLPLAYHPQLKTIAAGFIYS